MTAGFLVHIKGNHQKSKEYCSIFIIALFNLCSLTVCFGNLTVTEESLK